MPQRAAREGRRGSRTRPTPGSQTLAEFSGVALRKLSPPLPVGAVTEAVQRLRSAFTVLPLTPAVVLEALRDRQLCYFDAQIWATARLAQLEQVPSADFSAGATVGGITFVNPFAARNGRSLDG